MKIATSDIINPTIVSHKDVIFGDVDWIKIDETRPKKLDITMLLKLVREISLEYVFFYSIDGVASKIYIVKEKMHFM